MEESPSSCQAQGGSAQVSQSEVELVEEPVGVVVHKPGGIWYRAICQRVFHDVGDERGEMGKGWCQVDGSIAWKKVCLGIWVVEADAGVLCTAGCGVKRWLLVMTGSLIVSSAAAAGCEAMIDRRETNDKSRANGCGVVSKIFEV